MDVTQARSANKPGTAATQGEIPSRLVTVLDKTGPLLPAPLRYLPYACIARSRALSAPTQN